MLVIDCGRAFDFLSWYRALTIALATQEKPSLDSLRGQILWRLGSPGTCSASHFTKMELEKIGALSVDTKKVRALFPGLRPGISAAVSDISLANSMSAVPYVPGMIPTVGEARKGLAAAMSGIDQILQG
jgi:hypothetical protein